MKTVRFQTLIDEGVLQIGDGYRAKMEELTGTGYPFLRGEAVLERHIEVDGRERFHESLSPKLASKLSHAGDTVVTTKGNSTGRAAYVREDLPTFVYSPHLSFWRSLDHDKLDPGFLREWAHGPEFIGQLNGMKDSTDMAPYLSLTDQRRLKITLPSGDEQRAIARVLGALDDKIELNRRMNRTLEQLAETLFRSWFVDFDPVVAKAAGRKPAHLRPEFASLFPAHFQDSELGPIPEDWRVGTVDEIMQVTMGQSPPGDTYNDTGEGLPFFQGRTDFGFRFPTKRVFCTAPTRYAKKGDILLSVRAPVGDTNISLEDCSIGRGLAALRGRNDEQSFPFYAVRSQTDEFASFEAEGTLFGAINGPALRGLRLIIPPAPLMEAFEKCAGSWDSMIENNERESQTLAALRDTLLPKLLSGELRVKQAEKLIAAAS
jgi:type I restriction enzyme S subunit